MPEQYIYTIQPIRPEMLTDGPSDAEAVSLQGHVSYLQELTEKNIVLLAGRTQTTDDSSFGLVIFLADSEEEANNIMQADPAVRDKVMNATLYPYRIAVVADGISDLADS
jgi:uncharacterized protein YciI